MSKIFSTKWFNITKFKYEKSDYYRINQPEGVVVLPVTKQKKLVLIKQFRPCLSKKTLELPAGALEKNETKLQCAKRELLEETGYVSEKWKFLGTGVLRLERENTNNHFFLAKDCQLKKNNDDKNIVKLFEKKEFKKIIKQNKFDHIAAMISFIWAKEKFNIDFIF